VNGPALVRRMLDALHEEGVEAALAFVAEDFHGVVPPELSAEPDTYDGHAGLRHYFDTFQEIVDELRFDAEELVEVAPGAVAARGLITGRGRESGIPIEMRVPGLYRIRDGKVVGIEAYPSWEDAVAAGKQPG